MIKRVLLVSMLFAGTANAEVVLSPSEDGQLLIDGVAALTVDKVDDVVADTIRDMKLSKPHVYDAHNNLIEEIDLFDYSTSYAHGLVSFGDKRLHIDITDKSFRNNNIHLYDQTCSEIIGIRTSLIWHTDMALVQEHDIDYNITSNYVY